MRCVHNGTGAAQVGGSLRSVHGVCPARMPRDHPRHRRHRLRRRPARSPRCSSAATASARWPATPRAPTSPTASRRAKGDVSAATASHAALDGVDVAYYLVHAMGSGNGRRRLRRARPPRRAELRRAPRRRPACGASSTSAAWRPTAADSEHLRSREEVADDPRRARRRRPSTSARRWSSATGSASFVMLRSLVERLPAMITPRWIDTRTQPVAIDDVVATLAALADARGPAARRSSSAAPTSSPTAR